MNKKRDIKYHKLLADVKVLTDNLDSIRAEIKKINIKIKRMIK